mmetsp:Transcript_3077/g.2642  ORF Transcript_3077/g.2642 Transcript_3077/m.2642 type:complete len:95 (-) Transcript_3077:1118-1402(-)|eukprot:CAMPEP_0114587964 /NCGR_PEP_ID=MMETSP0125-20121206/10790_1 /TAXON_ID=485358 ORGANISM="Aristerostoma sp., Strain ATCC 50986" /NCGR_SAMPLE_ID=MMETSP0125 /ASSEMBLY_ACC=CAM_ASM_000245 /LENGTH=94 /DNA_ID=CAMNT_0001784133 /DNA_START=277 /DNA_END=561 /DNA_ORIENTATION=-
MKYIVTKPLTYKNEEVPHFGIIRAKKDYKYITASEPSLIPDNKKRLLKANGSQLITLNYAKVELDYNPISDDMKEICDALAECNVDDIYKTKLV